MLLFATCTGLVYLQDFNLKFCFTTFTFMPSLLNAGISIYSKEEEDQTRPFISFMLHVLFEDSRDTVTLTLWSGGVE